MRNLLSFEFNVERAKFIDHKLSAHGLDHKMWKQRHMQLTKYMVYGNDDNKIPKTTGWLQLYDKVATACN